VTEQGGAKKGKVSSPGERASREGERAQEQEKSPGLVIYLRGDLQGVKKKKKKKSWRKLPHYPLKQLKEKKTCEQNKADGDDSTFLEDDEGKRGRRKGGGFGGRRRKLTSP